MRKPLVAVQTFLRRRRAKSPARTPIAETAVEDVGQDGATLDIMQMMKILPASLSVPDGGPGDQD